MSKFTGIKQFAGESQPREAPMPSKAARRVGKRSDPGFQQISVYMNTEIYNEARKALIGGGRDFSDLVNDLVAVWVKKGSVSE